MLTLLNLLSAIALLVWGTHIVRTGILRVYGSHLRKILSHNVGRRPLAFAAGIGVTALVQSSNATALLVWALLKQGLMALPPDRLAAIRRKVAELAHTPSRPLVCPMLDETESACPVYAQRPVACRTYGFYVQRELGLYCGDIEARVAGGELGDVVWGNHDAVDQALGALGEMRPLTEWFERDIAAGSGAP